MISGRTFIPLLILLLGTGCTGLKYATPERPLFSDFEVEFTEEPEFESKAAKAELEGVVTPQPNNKILGMRPTVALHNMIKEPEKQKGLKFFLKYRLGSAPVYLEEVPVDDIVAAMENRMQNRGYFSATCRSTIERDDKTASITFTVDPGRPHVLRNINYHHTHASDSLGHFIAGQKDRSLLEPGMPYDLAKIVDERVRLSDHLRNKGYYRFRDGDLIFAADSTVGDHEVDLHLHIKSETLPQALLRYKLGNVYVHGDRDDILPPSDTIMHDSLYYINYLNVFRPNPIVRGVFLGPGDHYSMRRTDWTQSYLASYGVFKTTQILYSDENGRPGYLQADVILSPQKRFSFSSELNAVSKSNNFAGPGVRLGFQDRGLLRGGEILNVNLNGRFETQLGGQGGSTNAYEVGSKISLQIPRMVFFNRKKRPRPNSPTTRIDLGYTIFRRIGLYGISSANLSYNYIWRQNYKIWHEVQVPEVSYNSLNYTSPEFDAFLNENLLIKRSFEEQFILGVGYTFTYSSREPRSVNKPYYTAVLGFDEGGNIPYGITRLFQEPPETGYTLFGERYSQFFRFRPEFRFYMPIGINGDQIVSRLLFWSAFAYGNSEVVPFVKQYFAGGPMSIRAFRARNVGPGSYVSDRASNILIDQVGDLRLEANVEYRFTIAGMVKGAVFADAGNVWLLEEDPQRPGGKFDTDDALQEVAIGAGAGIRIDPEFLVIRLDLAFPIRRPDVPRGQRWIFDEQTEQVDFEKRPLLNIAIGYPF